MWRRALLWLVVPLFVLALTIACGARDDGEPPTTPVVPTETTPIDTPAAPPTDGPIGIETQASSDPYIYSPSDFELEAGVTYRFIITADAEFHTFTATNLGINVNLFANTTETVDFVVDKPGTYKYICIPHEISGMVGTITVR